MAHVLVWPLLLSNGWNLWLTILCLCCFCFCYVCEWVNVLSEWAPEFIKKIFTGFLSRGLEFFLSYWCWRNEQPCCELPIEMNEFRKLKISVPQLHLDCPEAWNKILGPHADSILLRVQLKWQVFLVNTNCVQWFNLVLTPQGQLFW